LDGFVSPERSGRRNRQIRTRFPQSNDWANSGIATRDRPCRTKAWTKERKIQCIESGAKPFNERSEAHSVAQSGRKIREEQQEHSSSTPLFALDADPDANFQDYYKPSMTVQDACGADPPDNCLVPDEYFDLFFIGGQPQPKILP
jgi:hypothetical protein